MVRAGLEKDLLLNVNVPYLQREQMNGFMVTRQGLRVYRDRLERRVDPRGRPYYWIGGEYPTGVPDEGTDFGAVMSGYVSITPLQLDLTAHRRVDQMRDWQWSM